MKSVSSDFERLLPGFLDDRLDDPEVEHFLSLLEEQDHLERLQSLLLTREILERAGQSGLPEVARPHRHSLRRSGAAVLLAAGLTGLVLALPWWDGDEQGTSGRSRSAENLRVTSAEAGMAFSIYHRNGRIVPRGLDGTIVFSDTDMVQPLLTCGHPCQAALLRLDEQGGLTWLKASPDQPFFVLQQAGSLEAPVQSMRGLRGLQRFVLLAWSGTSRVSTGQIESIRSERDIDALRPRPEVSQFRVQVVSGTDPQNESGRMQ